MTLILIFSCFVTPVQIALFENMSKAWTITNYSIDCLFLIDILVNFNLATYNEDMEVIEDRLSITKNYLKGWFSVDLIAIMPFDLMASTGESTRLVRMSRLGRIYKILKLIKLVRFFRLQRNNTDSFFEVVQSFMNFTK